MRFHHVKKLIKENQDLFEINMSPSSLQKLTNQIDARAGMEFEMIVPDIRVSDEDDFESEPDYDQDESTGSLEDIEDFFVGEHNSRNHVRRAIREIEEEFDSEDEERKQEAWGDDAHEAVLMFMWHEHKAEYLADAEKEIRREYPDMDPESADFKLMVTALAKENLPDLVDKEMADLGEDYDAAFEEWSNDWSDNRDQRIADWLEEHYPYMTDIRHAFDLEWPHWTEYEGEGGADINHTADAFSYAIGKPVNAATGYHRGTREPGKYVVEPDGSLEPDDSSDYGLEFVSPPMPITELLSDLDKVKRWADKTGCYTNGSTGLHINISVPGYSINKLDYVKLALLIGDQYILKEFDRLGNIYCKSAITKIENTLKNRPEATTQVLEKMQGQMNEIASKIIHTGMTDKYTSINTKSGYIEFRSPGNDWLSDKYFNKIKPTLMRFVVSLDAAIDPEKYKNEYYKKLYKLLTPEGSSESYVKMIQDFSEYVSGVGGAPEKVVADFRRNALNALRQERGKTKVEPKQVGNWGVWAKVPNRFVRVGSDDDSQLRRFKAPELARAWILSTSLSPERFEAREIPADYQHPATDELALWYVSIIGRPGSEVQVRARNHDSAVRIASQFRPDIFGNEQGNIRASTVPVSQAPGMTGTHTYRAFNTMNNQTIGTFQAGPRGNMVNPPARAFAELLARTGDDERYADFEVIGQERQPTPPQAPLGGQNYPRNFEIYDIRTGQRMEAFYAPSDGAAVEFANDYRAMGPHRLSPQEASLRYGLRRIDDMPQQQQQPQQGQVIAPGLGETPPQPLSAGRELVGWTIKIGGQPVHTLSGIGNNQGDANTIARQWILRQGSAFLNRYHGQEIEIVPEFRAA